MTEEMTQAGPVNTTPITHKHITPEEIKKGCIEIAGDSPDGVRICRINQELEQGMREMEAYENSVTFYGSARFMEGNVYYDRVRTLAQRIVKDLDSTIISGGGPGIMEAANRGAYEAGGKSIGLSIKLPMEQKDNPYITDDVPFYFFFARKVALSFTSKVFIFCPGGFGTFDEFFEVLTLIQTRKMAQIPIILYGTEFWNPFVELFRTIMCDQLKTISPEDFDLFTVTDDDEKVIEIIKNAKSRKGSYGYE